MTQSKVIPDHTAVRTALWRAQHVELDSKPSVFDDVIGLKLASPDANWRERPDMHPMGTKGYRASIVGRARFIEDLLAEKVSHGLDQYVILGAGLDTFIQRNPALASKIKTFEIDEPATQVWKIQKLKELGYEIPAYLKFVPVDFEKGESWPVQLLVNGFDPKQSSFVASTGVAMYLSRDANMDTLRKIASFARGSIFAMTFMLPVDMVEPQERAQYEFVMERAKAAGTPFQSLFRPDEILQMAREAGFKNVGHVSRIDLIARYFSGRSDGLIPSSGEEFLVAQT